MAHRGSRLLWPENTMEAFQGAVDLGYRYLETDLWPTSDGVLMAFHDATLDRTTNGTGPISERTLAEVKQLDAGYNHEVDGDHPHRGNGVTVPTLEELLVAFPEAVFTLDLKAPRIEALLFSMLSRLAATERVIVGSFSDAKLRRFRSISSGRVATSSGPRETAQALGRARLGRPIRIEADALQVPDRAGPVRVVSQTVVAAAHAVDKEVHVWTVNDRAHMEELLDAGVDGIITDRPDILREVMIGRGSGGPWNKGAGQAPGGEDG
jgi:glycerophosphoryl diester phosphodiesterase